jgi:hypothetical protein
MNEPLHHRMRTPALLVVASLSVLSGCGARVTVYRMPEAHADLRSGYSEPIPPAPRKVEQDLAISVTSSPSVACSLSAAAGDGSGCVELHATSESEEKDETRTELLGGQAGYGWVLHDLGPTLAAILKERLEARFRRVTVTTDATPRANALQVKPFIDRMVTPVRVTLTVSGGGRGPIRASGESTHSWSRGHLGWAVPAFALTFPVSFFWVPPILRSVQEKHEKIALAEAIDHAAESLAEQLAARP